MAKLAALFILCMVNYCLGSGGAAGGGHSGGIAAVSSEVPENVRVMTVPKKLQFYCNATQDEQGEYPSIDWYHNGKSFSSSERVHVHQNGTVIIEPTEKEDVGEYNCKYHSDTLNAANERTYTVIILSYKKLPKSGTAIEEENFSLTCDVVGEPLPWVKWRKDNESIGDAITDGRYNLTRKDDTKPEDSTLTIYGIKWEDRGMYECCFSNFEGFELCTNSYIRVKDIYAALWPFLGIVLEVVILCLIIFIYEKRRTKNDFEESDTDQGNNMKEGPN